MQHTIRREYAPDYWNTEYRSLDGTNEQFRLSPSTQEYIDILAEVRVALRNSKLEITSIERNQNTHDLGQLLIREQLLCVANPGREYYRVRRYITIKKQFLHNALNYNLDQRRCGKSSLTFQKQITYYDSDDIIIIVQVVTSDKNECSVTPDNSSDYFIDYIVNL